METTVRVTDYKGGADVIMSTFNNPADDGPFIVVIVWILYPILKTKQNKKKTLSKLDLL